MSQHDYDIANQQGSPFRADLNAVLAAIQSMNSGGTAPENTVAYMPWADTASGLLKIRNAANSGWVEVAALSNFAMPSVQKQLATAFTTTGTSTAYLLTPAPAIAANTAGTRFRVSFHTAPTGTPTLAVSGQAALPLKYKDITGTKQTITSVHVPANWTADVETDGTDWLVINIAPFLWANVLEADGPGSGLNADLLDGQHASYFSPTTHNHNGVYVGVDNGHNALGSFCFGRVYNSSDAPGTLFSGSSISPACLYESGNIHYSGTLSGTWRCLGQLFGSGYGYSAVTLWQRVA